MASRNWVGTRALALANYILDKILHHVKFMNRSQRFMIETRNGNHFFAIDQSRRF